MVAAGTWTDCWPTECDPKITSRFLVCICLRTQFLQILLLCFQSWWLTDQPKLLSLQGKVLLFQKGHVLSRKLELKAISSALLTKSSTSILTVELNIVVNIQ